MALRLGKGRLGRRKGEWITETAPLPRGWYRRDHPLRLHDYPRDRHPPPSQLCKAFKSLFSPGIRLSRVLHAVVGVEPIRRHPEDVV